MAFFASKPLQQKLPYSIPLCKCPSLLSSFKFQTPSSFLTSPLSKHPLRLSFLVGRGHASSHYETKVSITDQHLSKSSTNHRYDRRAVSHSRDKNRRAEQKSAEKGEGSEMGENVRKSARRDRFSGERVGSMERSPMDSDLSSMSPEDENLVRKLTETIGNLTVKKAEKKPKKGVYKKLGVEKMDKGSEQSKSESPEVMLRVGLDMCSKKGDVMGALELYDSAQREGIKIGQYHYNVLLYLCSSAAIGVVQPAKSGSGNRTLNTLESRGDISAVNSEVLGEVGEIHVVYFNNTVSNNLTSNSELLLKSNNHPVHTGRSNLDLNRFVTNVGKDNSSSILNGKGKFAQASNGVAVPNCREIDVIINSGSGDYVFKSTNDGNKLANYQIQVNEDLKKYALRRGYEIYEKMRLEKIPMNEASLTSVARMALAMGNGDMAFDTVKQMKALGINPRLRSYGPALSAFCTSGNVEKAFSVEQHMQENGVHPEEPELEMLLRVSIEAGRSDKVYYLLHKLRSGVRRVSPSTADLIEKWFKSKIASQVGKRKWDQSFIREAIENGGGGWHGQGWLGKGKWTVSCTSVGDDGLCKCCGEKLATIDLDPKETEKFAESVASIAVQREKNSSFQKFQKWLDYYGPFEAVIDGANIGLYTQRKFKPSKVNAVVNGIRQLLPSKTWPLIVLHNRRIIGDNMDKPVNKALVEKWKNADALYATPTGSNDDWYWLYAAIKFKCLIVTNDEMRDHLFQLLGDDFFPKWKERHQVHFSFSDTGPVFHMPPPCSVVIQESEKGHWHIPIASEQDYEEERTWLCVTRTNSSRPTLVSAITQEASQFQFQNKASGGSDSQKKVRARPTPLNHGNLNNCRDSINTQESYSNLRNILTTSVVSDYPTILPQIEAAEKLGNCVIDFEI